METVNKVVNAATAALWGDGSTAQQQTTPHGEEPIAGVQGKGSPTDPYDAGNREEQPSAPISEGNTSPQDPGLDGAKKNDPNQKDLIADIKTDDVDLTKPTPTAAIPNPPTLTSPALSPVPVIGAPSTPTPAEAGGSSTATAVAPATPTPAEAGGSSTATAAAPATPTAEPKTEQRMAEIPAGESSHASRTDHHEVSEEALKGPQGPAPVPAEEFEKEAQEMKPAAKDVGGVESRSSKSSQGSEKGNGKHGPLHKMKERLNKVVHPHHSNNKT